MELNINSPKYYKEVYGIDDEIYRLCQEIYVYFNVDDDLYDLQFPINLSGVFLPPEPPKGKGKNKLKPIEEAQNESDNIGSEETYTNTEHST